MRTTDRIGFKLIIKEPDTAERTIVVCPRYDGLKMKWQRESGKVYHTLDFEGNLEFWGVDFVTLLNCPLRTVFELVVFLKGRGEVGRSEFRKTDCEWNLNDGWCKVDISTYDKYSKINDHKDDEFNVVKLGLNKHSLQFWRYPIFQTYIRGDKQVANFGFVTKGGRAVDCMESNDMTALREMFFFNQGYKGGSAFYAGSGTYAGRYRSLNDTFENVGGFYTLRAGGVGNYEIWLSTFSDTNGPHFWFELRDTGVSPATQISRYPVGSTSYINGLDALLSTHSVLLGGVWMDTRIWIASSRLLTDVSLSGTNMGALDSEKDIASQSYHYGKNMHEGGIIAVSSRTSNEDKGYGMVENTNEYYDTPDDTYNYVPLYRDSWMKGCSVWAKERLITQSEKTSYQSQKRVDDFYLFTDVVRAVIQKIDPTIVFDDSDSHFLADATNPVSGNPQGPIYISQKSNVLNLGYDYPAWQAPVKWSQIDTFLKNALGCYCDLYEDSNGVTHLRIEHQFFYDNGGTYNPQGNPSATIDLLHNRFDVATRQPQAFHTNRWKWDVDGNGLYSSACRYEYGWMDTQSAIFDGETVEVPEEYRLFTDDKTEERKVDWFSSDIDFLTAVQAECSSDGFVVVMESYTNPGWIVSGHENYSGQNYQLSFEYLQPLYLVYGIYAEKVQIGEGDPFQTTSNARMRTSEVSFNLLEGEWAEPSDVLITEVGEGVIDTLTYDMSSEKWTATVRYNNE